MQYLRQFENEAPKQHANLMFLEQENAKKNSKRVLLTDTVRNKCLK